MGVDFRVDTEEDACSTSIGYGGLQRIRKTLIKATVAYAKKKKEKNVVTLLNTWTPTPLSRAEMFRRIQNGTMGMEDIMGNAGGIDYQAIAKTSDEDLQFLVNQKLIGVYNFVQHSDCDGDWDHKIRDSVTEWLQLILPHVPDDRVPEEKEDSNPKKKRKVGNPEVSEALLSAFPCRPDIQFVEELVDVFKQATEKKVKVVMS